MKKAGMLVAVEMDAVFQRFGNALEPVHMPGYEVYRFLLGETELFVLSSGEGEIAAAAGTQLLISVFGAEVVFNFGVVGGLTEEMSLARTCVVERVVHYDFDISALDPVKPGQYTRFADEYIPISQALVEKAVAVEPSLKRVTCASGDKFVAEREKKQALHDRFDADICEMEAAAIALTCHRSGIPCLMIKTVSDSIDGGAAEFKKAVLSSAELCLKVTEKILREL